MVWAVAGIAAVAAVLMGVGGMGAARADEPKKTPPAKTPATSPEASPAASPSATPGTAAPAGKQRPETTPTSSKEKTTAGTGEALGFKMNRIDGTSEDLSKYKGKVVVIVNVASKCGFTGQYAGLEELYKKHEKDGLVVLGFPANDFNGQEPGTNDEIAKFCSATYGVTFPMFEKVSVKGADAHPLYKLLASQPAPIGGEPKWNFTKFVIGRDGKVAGRVDADRAYVRGKQIEPDVEKLVVSLLAATPTKPATPATGETPAQQPKNAPAAK